MITKDEFLERFKDFPMICKGCKKYSEKCDTMDMCVFIRNKIIEYNTDKSAEHPTNEGEDIVRHSFEKRRVQDKEPACND